MKKRFLTIILSACLFIIGAFSLSACDLSHKHYLNDYGVCKQCNQDVCFIASGDGVGNYKAENINCQLVFETYVKFVATKSAPVEITITCGTAKVNNFIMYALSNRQLAYCYNSDDLRATTSEPLTAGTTYYIKVKVTTAGSLSVNVNSIV